MTERFRPQPEDPNQNTPEAGSGPLGKPPPNPEQSPQDGGNKSPDEALLDTAEEIVSKRIQRDVRKSLRPISLHKAPFDHDPTVREKKLLDRALKRVLAEGFDDLMMLQKGALEEEIVQEELEAHEAKGCIDYVKTEQTMSGRLNLVESCVTDEKLARMQRHNPEFTDPLVTALQKRPARKEKAERAMQRIYQRRGEDERRS